VKPDIVRIKASDVRVIAFTGSRAISLPADASGPMPQSIVWMPVGVHAITAGTLDGDGYQGEVICDEQAARAISASFLSIQASGQRVWIDFDHNDGEAAAWVKSFAWDPSQGIVANLEWTAKGEQAIRGKSYYSFSPAFEAQKSTGRVLGLIDGHAAGGLVNAPAFGAAMPALIAARLGGSPSNKPAPGGNPSNNHTHPMKEILLKLLAAYKVTPPADATEDALVALVAKHTTEAGSAQTAQITALKDELAKATKDANEAKDAVAVAARKAGEAADAHKREIEEVKTTIAGIQAARASVETTDITDILGAYAAKDPCHIPAVKINATVRADLARQRARIFARDIQPFMSKNRLGAFDLMLLANEKRDGIAKIAAKTDVAKVTAANSLGTLSGSLIAQISLSLLKAKLPALKVFTTDFSMENSKLNQTVITRVRGIPTVQTYAAATGYQSTGVTDTDIPVTITDHRYSQFQYNANELASTNRNLFNEQAEGVLYAIGKDLVDAVLALFTAANYYTTPGSPNPNDGNGGHTVVASASWGRPALINARASLVGRHVYPDMDRGFALQNPTYYGQLAQDPSLVSLAVFNDPNIITSGQLPPISGILPVEYADFPANGISLGAIVGTAGSAIIATRLPYDYVDAQIGSNYGAVSQVEDPDTGLGVMLVQYVNHDLGVSNYRVAVMKGQAVGDSARAQLITSV
jgi:phage I-like protein